MMQAEECGTNSKSMATKKNGQVLFTEGEVNKGAGSVNPTPTDVVETESDEVKAERERDKQSKYLDNILAESDAQVKAAQGRAATARNKYDSWLQSAYTPEGTADKVEREKAENRQSRMAAITDGIIGLANIIGTANGATPVQHEPMSKANKERLANEAKYRRENNKLYEQRLLKEADALRKAEDDAARAKDRDLGRRLGIDRNNAMRKQASDNLEYRKQRDDAQDKKDERDFNYKKQQDNIKNNQRARQLAINANRSSGSGKDNEEERRADIYWEHGLTAPEREKLLGFNLSTFSQNKPEKEIKLRVLREAESKRGRKFSMAPTTEFVKKWRAQTGLRSGKKTNLTPGNTKNTKNKR